MITIEEIKNECLAIIAQAEKATPGPWMSEGSWIGKDNACVASCCHYAHDSDASFIASSRAFTPRAAKALLTAITGYQSDMCANEAGCIAYNKASERIETIRRTWEESK